MKYNEDLCVTTLTIGEKLETFLIEHIAKGLVAEEEDKYKIITLRLADHTENIEFYYIQFDDGTDIRIPISLFAIREQACINEQSIPLKYKLGYKDEK